MLLNQRAIVGTFDSTYVVVHAVVLDVRNTIRKIPITTSAVFLWTSRIVNNFVGPISVYHEIAVKVKILHNFVWRIVQRSKSSRQLSRK